MKTPWIYGGEPARVPDGNRAPPTYVDGRRSHGSAGQRRAARIGGRGRWGRFVAARLASLLVLATLLLMPAVPTPRGHPWPGYLFGTLQSDPAYAAVDYAAGARLAEVDLDWSLYEPQDGLFDANYIRKAGDKVGALRTAGFRISLSVNLGGAPGWLLKDPDARYMNQFGVTVGPNFAFSQTARAKAEAYVRHVAQDLGTDFYSLRVGFSPQTSELLFPPGDDGRGHKDSLWAYDSNAQKTNPFPGWRPGDRTYRGRPFSTDEVDQWYRWYVGALVQAGDWEEALFKSLGFPGYVAWLLPGPGMRPFDTKRYVAAYLTGSNGYDELVGPVGAVWNLVVDDISDKRDVQIQNTGIADASGHPWANVCEPSDHQISLDDSTIANWSSARWTTYNADRWGLRKTAENPGPYDDVSVLRAAAAIVAACGMEAWYYAFDFSLHDTTHGAATIADVQRELTSGRQLPNSDPSGLPLSLHWLRRVGG